MPFDDYYSQQGKGNVYEGPLWQAGNGIRGYAGRDLQYGRGLGSFGRMIWRYAKPILSYLGKQSIKAGVDIGSDVLSGKPVKETITKRLKDSGAAVIEDAAGLAKRKLVGNGRKKMARRRRRRNKKGATRKKGAVRKRRSTRRRSKKSLSDIFS